MITKKRRSLKTQLTEEHSSRFRWVSWQLRQISPVWQHAAAIEKRSPSTRAGCTDGTGHRGRGQRPQESGAGRGQSGQGQSGWGQSGWRQSGRDYQAFITLRMRDLFASSCEPN